MKRSAALSIVALALVGASCREEETPYEQPGVDTLPAVTLPVPDLATVPLIGQACVVGDRQKYPAAIVTLDPDYALQWAARNGHEGASLAELADSPDVHAEIEHAIDGVNERFTRAYQIKKFTILPDEWLPNSDVLTPTFKLKRRGIAARYAPEIAAMYT